QQSLIPYDPTTPAPRKETWSRPSLARRHGSRRDRTRQICGEAANKEVLMNWKLGAGALGLLALSMGSPLARAAVHRDGPKSKSDPTSDVNDVFAWMSSDASKVYLAMTVFPAATTTSRFSNTVQYVFNVYSTAK